MEHSRGLSSIYGSRMASRASVEFIKETRTTSPLHNLIFGLPTTTEAQVIDVDLFSTQEEEKYHPKGGLGTSFWISYIKIRMLDQFKVVIPLLLCMFLYGVIFLRQKVELEIGLVIGAMLLVVVGLAMFLEGLKLGVMPLGEVIGKTLPIKVPLWATLLVAFFLGILVTFAEPAIGALQEVGGSIDTFESPYLYYILNQWDLYVVLVVGVGVGCAAVVGTLRFLFRISIKPIIYISVSFTLFITILGY